MTETSDLLIFWLVVAARFFVPFFIPRYPLPGVLTSLVLDGIDQTIFQKYTNLPLDNYQGYDKALDVYYLTITYISTVRNWVDVFAFKIDRFLIYYRLIGVTLFELIQFRPLLMIFPNTFEYFFILYSLISTKWDPTRVSKRYWIIGTALIWIIIKMPQEYIIHIAQVDTTDWIAMNLLGGPDSSIPIWVLIAAAVLFLLLALGIAWLVRRIPAADWAFTLSAKQTRRTSRVEPMLANNTAQPDRFFGKVLFEKALMVSLVGIIFAQVLPDMRATSMEIIVGGIILIIVNTALSQWLGMHEPGQLTKLREFPVLATVNFVLVLLIAILLPTFDGSINLVNAIFFTLLFTVVVTMFDRSRIRRLRQATAAD